MIWGGGYRYDPNGNPTNMLTHEGSFRFDYDAVNWLVGASYPGGRTECFDYDNAGNRTNHVLITGTVTNRTRLTYAAANRLTQTVSGTLTNLYRCNGAGRVTNHVVAGRDRWIGYDFRGRMRSLVDTNGVSYSYEFDGDGNRRREVVGGTVRRFIYDGPNPVLELDGAGVVQAVYVQGPGIDQMIEKISYVGGVADGRYVYHADHLGSVHAITDDLQATVQTYGYEAFGRVRWTTGSGPVGGNRFTYTGREPVGDTAGWYYYRWRVMDPNVGRFTSEDPLGFVDGVNVYGYASLCPIHHVDRMGLLIASPNDWVASGYSPPTSAPPGIGSQPSPAHGLPQGFSLNLVGEVGYAFGLMQIGVGNASCCDLAGNLWKVKYIKICIGIGFGFSAAVGPTLGSTLGNCPNSFAGDTIEVMGGYGPIAGGGAISPGTGAGTPMIGLGVGGTVMWCKNKITSARVSGRCSCP